MSRSAKKGPFVDEKVGNAMASADRFVQQVYAELKPATATR